MQYMTGIFNEKFKALLKEAQFTKEMLGSGATQIRKANYATKGVYFQSFTSLSTGLERIGKLCLMLDHYIETSGKFPDSKYFKKIGHNILLIYQQSMTVVERRKISLRFLKNLDGKIHQNILVLLSDFALGQRYSSIDLLAGEVRRSDPIALWAEQVDQMILELCISPARKAKIKQNARVIDQMVGRFTNVLHISESGDETTNVEDASYQTGVWEAVAPQRQLFVLQVIRFWVELLFDLQYKAMAVGREDIPYFNEIFAGFCNEDSYIRTRKTWDKI
jgi:hypothetical protein